MKKEQFTKIQLVQIYIMQSFQQLQSQNLSNYNNHQINISQPYKRHHQPYNLITQMKKHQFILESYNSNLYFQNSKQIQECKNSLSLLKNKKQFYIQIEKELVNVFVIFALGNMQFMQKEQILSLFLKLVDTEHQQQIQNIYKQYLQFQRDISKESIIDRIKYVCNDIKTHFQTLSKAKVFCDNQRVLRQLYLLYPSATFKLQHERKGKNAKAYIKSFQVKETNQVIIAIFQQSSRQIFKKLHQDVQDQQILNKYLLENNILIQQLVKKQTQKVQREKEQWKQAYLKLQKQKQTKKEIQKNKYNPMTKFKQFIYRQSRESYNFHLILPVLVVTFVVFSINLILNISSALYKNIIQIIYVFFQEIIMVVIPIILKFVYSIAEIMVTSLYETIWPPFILIMGIIAVFSYKCILNHLGTQLIKQAGFSQGYWN